MFIATGTRGQSAWPDHTVKIIIPYPAGTPRPIVDKLSAAMKQIAADPELQKRFLAVGARSMSSTPEEAVAYAARERALWKDVVALSGIKPQ